MRSVDTILLIPLIQIWNQRISLSSLGVDGLKFRFEHIHGTRLTMLVSSVATQNDPVSGEVCMHKETGVFTTVCGISLDGSPDRNDSIPLVIATRSPITSGSCCNHVEWQYSTIYCWYQHCPDTSYPLWGVIRAGVVTIVPCTLRMITIPVTSNYCCFWCCCCFYRCCPRRGSTTTVGKFVG